MKQNKLWKSTLNCSMRLKILTNLASFDMETERRIGWKDEDFPIVITGPIARRGRSRWKLDELGWEEAIAV